jgi:hypothetical protein
LLRKPSLSHYGARDSGLPLASLAWERGIEGVRGIESA